MNFPALSQIEEHIARLSLDAQLWLIARVPNVSVPNSLHQAPWTRSSQPWRLTQDPKRVAGHCRGIRLCRGRWLGTRRTAIQRRDIYFVNLNPVKPVTSGQRPVLVVSIDAINSLPLVRRQALIFG